jgi:type I restriction-modification system DNA methylase subunit
MNALQKIEVASKRLGYSADAIQYDYGFNQFASGDTGLRKAALAVFTQTPASYRSAAFGVATGETGDAAVIVEQHRALGAPLFFVIDHDQVSVWQVYGEGPARLIERTPLGELDNLFDRHQESWAPDSIHRAKSIGKFDSTYQLDFVDAGLLPAIEGQVHQKLDRLLNEVIASIGLSDKGRIDERQMFQGVFRLLAAKVLLDRTHSVSRQWDVHNVGAVLAGIGEYYNLPSEARFTSAVTARQFATGWELLRKGFNVANISADDLAYVYENTLVTPETRQALGTHSTPRQVAEYITGQLRLWHPDSSHLKVYEPFTGAGVLLVAALRHMRGALPSEWTDKKRHAYLVKHLAGAEIDSFACEVATLSLILADYPNTNGWKIANKDLLGDEALAGDLKNADVILCNPPFEPLTEADRVRYPLFSKVGGNKAETVLKLALHAAPQALGFVLPRAFLMDKAYSWHRREIERLYGDIEVVSLPDKIFRESKVESALLIARAPTAAGERQRLRSSEVTDQDRRRFLSLGVPSESREQVRAVPDAQTGALWIRRLDPLWTYLSANPTLGNVVTAHWGLRWKDGQARALRDGPGPGHVQGLSKAIDHRQFAIGRIGWLDIAADGVYGARDLPWDRPKILCNAIRSSRGAWRISAAVDRDGMYASQQFVVIFTKNNDVDLDALAAIINSPLGNAYMHQFSADKRLRIGTLLAMPMPEKIPPRLGDLARDYARSVSHGGTFKDQGLAALLDEIDTIVLDAYDLPPRLIRSLLSEFRCERRPLVHEWQDWGVGEDDPALTLSELRSEWVRRSRGSWLTQELPPLPRDEDALLARIGGLLP